VNDQLAQPDTSSIETDFETIQRVLDGDKVYFEVLMRRYNNRLFRVARSVVKNDDDAMDIVQESWITAFYKLKMFRGPDGFGAWASRITYNNALARLRKQKQVDISFDDVESIPARGHASAEPHEELAKQQLSSALELAVNNLPDKYRVVFVLRTIQQLSTRETAASLELSEGTVKQRLLRSKRMLQGSLLRRVEGSGVTIWEFAGHRCDRIVVTVLSAIGKG